MSSPAAEHHPDGEADDPASALRTRAIRSFSGRRGKFTAGQRRAYDRLLANYRIEPACGGLLDLASIFGRSAPTVLEIGFGMGEATAEIARGRPEHDFVGIEVYPAGVGSLLRRLESLGLTNVRIIQRDAAEAIALIPPASLAAIHVFFPDPWPKARHHKRRLLQPGMVSRLAALLAPGGTLHCATDWEDYARQMLEVLSGEPTLVNRSTGFAERPAWRPVTKFERRGIALGHVVRDLAFDKAGIATAQTGQADH